MSRHAQTGGRAVTAKATFKKWHNTVALRPGEKQKYDDQLRQSGWYDEQALIMRVEPEAEAWTYADIKHYWGHLVSPFTKANPGWTVGETHTYFKSLFIREGAWSLTELNREELRDFLSEVTRHILTEHPRVQLPFDADLWLLDPNT